ncbi:MAG: TIM barrel protein [Akkermansiaceae bacterium]|nr:TIM barrel protein [Akkermansiaceae bacterium]MCP5551888.1 TIM barrel protein [Akkermansiaceae bacterium]
MESNPLSRRSFVSGSAAAVASVAATLHHRFGLADEAAAKAGVKGKVRHSACKWCYKDVSLDDLCAAGKVFGLESVELLMPEDFPTLKKHGLHCAMVSFPTAEIEIGGKKTKVGPIPKSFNRLEHHDALVAAYEPHLKASADAGFTNVICFSGNREGLDDERGLENCAVGLKRLMPLCEKLGVTLSMELLNSKVNHADYMCDHSDWGVELCRRVGSERFKLLYDIYHMQIMEGDVIATIRKHHEFFSHYHTGGVPGRHEIDDTQELYYPAIVKAIVETGFDGWVAQEFIPAREDKIASLRQGVEICTV